MGNFKCSSVYTCGLRTCATSSTSSCGAAGSVLACGWERQRAKKAGYSTVKNIGFVTGLGLRGPVCNIGL